MRRAAVTLILACFLALLFGGIAAPAKRIGLIRVFARTTVEHDTGVHHFVVKAVLDKRGKKIGEIAQSCTDTIGRQTCVGEIDMPLGRIVYVGTRRSARFYQFVVTGGTGIYAGSGGTYTSTTIALDPRLEYVLVSLVP